VADAPEVDDVAGVWATDFRTTVTKHELTLDFVREDPFDSGAVVVARVACSHAVFADLVEDLEATWQDWVWRSSPPEEPLTESESQPRKPWRRPLSAEKRAVLDRYMENLKAEQRRRFPHLTPPEFRDKERSE
jgi:hypothetical protein